MDKIVYTVKEVSELLGIGINQAYELVKTDGFPKFKIGNKYMVPKDQFEEWMRKQT
jgi:excisionase family DNA binding protein